MFSDVRGGESRSKVRGVHSAETNFLTETTRSLGRNISTSGLQPSEFSHLPAILGDGIMAVRPRPASIIADPQTLSGPCGGPDAGGRAARQPRLFVTFTFRPHPSGPGYLLHRRHALRPGSAV